jgi:hypothetical protein
MILEYIRWLNYSYSQIIADYRCLDWPINCLKSTTLRWDWPSMKPGARDGVPPCPRASWLSPWSSSHCLEHLVPRYVSQGGRNHCRKSLTISYNFLQFLTISYSVSRLLYLWSTNAILTWVCLKMEDTPFQTWQKHDDRIFGHSSVTSVYLDTMPRDSSPSPIEILGGFLGVYCPLVLVAGICWDLLRVGDAFRWHTCIC